MNSVLPEVCKEAGVTMSQDNSKAPLPGSSEAIKAGCTCPVLDNHHGRGFMLDGETCFWYSGDCPLHGKREIIDVAECD